MGRHWRTAKAKAQQIHGAYVQLDERTLPKS